MTSIHIDAGRHWLVVGQTGAGKTYWARNWLLPRFRRQIVLDTEEMEFDDKVWTPVDIARAVRLAKRDEPFRVRIPMDVGEPGQDQYDLLSDGLLDGGHDTFLWVDEYADFTPGSTQSSAGLRLTRKARKRGITMAFATQRPQAIDKTAYTQASHHVWFGLDPADVDYWHTRAPYLSTLAPRAPVGSYIWVYHHSADAPTGKLMGPVEEYRWPRKR